jgi:hypothetical protein
MQHTTTCEQCLATIYNLEGKKCDKQNCPIIMKDQPEPYGFKRDCIGNDAINEHAGLPQMVKK